MIDLKEYADDHCLELVTTTEGTNGYPKNLKKVVTGFDTFEDALQCAREIEGEVCLISKRDGHQFWMDHGSAYGPIEINDEWFKDDYVVIRGVSASDWWKEKYENLKSTLLKDVGNCPEPEQIVNIIQIFQTYSKLYDMIESLGENEQIYYENGYPQNAEIVPIKTMRYHNFDVHEYAIAVTTKVHSSMARTTIMLNPETYRNFKAYAAETGQTISALINNFMEQAIDMNKQKTT